MQVVLIVRARMERIILATSRALLATIAVWYVGVQVAIQTGHFRSSTWRLNFLLAAGWRLGPVLVVTRTTNREEERNTSGRIVAEEKQQSIVIVAGTNRTVSTSCHSPFSIIDYTIYTGRIFSLEKNINAT